MGANSSAVRTMSDMNTSRHIGTAGTPLRGVGRFSTAVLCVCVCAAVVALTWTFARPQPRVGPAVTEQPKPEDVTDTTSVPAQAIPIEAAVVQVMNSHAQSFSSEMQAQAALERATASEVDPGPLLANYPQDLDPMTVNLEESDNYTTSREFLVTVTPPGSRGCFVVPESGSPKVKPC
jgi:hypothetical protein